jgi:preprotein translocase subunit SecF
MLSGTYSSIFIATPVLADLKEREPQYKALAKRLAARSASPRVAKQTAARAQAGVPAGPAGAGATAITPGDQASDSGAGDDSDLYDDATGPGEDAGAPAPKSVGAGRTAPGNRPAAAPGSRQQPRRTSAAKRRPNAKKKRR